jgi:hypothetical protein
VAGLLPYAALNYAVTAVYSQPSHAVRVRPFATAHQAISHRCRRSTRPPRTASIFTRLINCCWSLFQWGLFLAVAAALVVGGYLYFRLDDEIRRQVEQRIASHYRHLDVHIGGARFEKDRGISISKLAIFEPQRGNTPQSLLSIDELYLSGAVRMEDLVSGQPNIDRIIVRRAHLYAIRQADGKWNVSALVPLPKFSEQTPVLAIEDATLILEEAGRPVGGSMTIRGVDITLTPLPPTDTTVKSRRYGVKCTVTGMSAREVRVEGELDSADGSLDLKIVVGGLEVSPELLASVPCLPEDVLAKANFSGRADMAVQVTRGSGPDAALNWSAQARIDRGQLSHPLLPHPLTDLAVTIQAAANRLTVEKLTGKCGTAEVALACTRHGWATAAPLGLSVRVTGLPLDNELEGVLPAALAKFWTRFQPRGLVDAEVGLAFDGQKWRPALTADCRGISLTDLDRFPYPLEQATGQLVYTPADGGQPDQLRMNLTAVGGGRPIQIDVQLAQLAAKLTPIAAVHPPSAQPRPSATWKSRAPTSQCTSSSWRQCRKKAGSWSSHCDRRVCSTFAGGPSGPIRCSPRRTSRRRSCSKTARFSTRSSTTCCAMSMGWSRSEIDFGNCTTCKAKGAMNRLLSSAAANQFRRAMAANST